jgi:hypothetical protein
LQRWNALEQIGPASMNLLGLVVDGDARLPQRIDGRILGHGPAALVCPDP